MHIKRYYDLLLAAEAIGGSYAVGYKKGLTRHVFADDPNHWKNHTKYMDEDNTSDKAIGYRDGFAADIPRRLGDPSHR